MGRLEKLDVQRQTGQLVAPSDVLAAIERANGFKIGQDLKVVVETTKPAAPAAAPEEQAPPK